MPTELRLLALAVITVVAVPIAVSAWPDPTLVATAVAALVVAAACMLIATPPMVNIAVAVVAGGATAAVAVASGTVGTVALLVAPLAVASLRVDWRPAVWAAAFGLGGAVLLAPGVASQPIVTSPGVAWLTMALLASWTLTVVLIERMTKERAPAVPPLDPACSRS